VGALLEEGGERQTAGLGSFLVTPGEEPDFVTLTLSPESVAPRSREESPLEPSRTEADVCGQASPVSLDSTDLPAA